VLSHISINVLRLFGKEDSAGNALFSALLDSSIARDLKHEKYKDATEHFTKWNKICVGKNLVPLEWSNKKKN